VSKLSAKVSVIIPAYGDSPLLPKVVSCALRSGNLDIEVIIVDNGLERTVLDSALSAGKGRAMAVQAGKNLGAAAGRNVGASVASGDYLLFLDHDVLLGCCAAERMVKFLESHREFGIVGPLIRYLDNKERVWWSGGGVDRKSGRVYMYTDVPTRDFRETDVVPSAILVRRGVYEDVGGFYEPFFATFEDSDFCYRAKAKGHRVGCVCSAEAYHSLPSDLMEAERRLIKRVRFVTRNRTIFIARNAYSRRTLITYILLFNNIYVIYYVYKALRLGGLYSALDAARGYVEGLAFIGKGKGSPL
jgi:GT2 family glycosyltransferase